MNIWNRFAGILGLLAIGFGLASSLLFQSFGDSYTQLHLALGVMLIAYWFFTVGAKRASETKQIVKGRTVRFGITAFVYSILFFAVLISCNWLVNRYNKRADFTAEGVYSLSSESTQVVQALKKPLKIVIFDIKSNKQQQEAPTNEPKDLLALYKSGNHDKVSTEFINPRSKPQLVDLYGMKGDNTVYLEYGEGDTKAVSRISDATEDAITNAIVKLTQGEAKKVYFLQGHGEPDLTDATKRGLKFFADAVKDDHLTMQGIVLSQQKKVPDDAAAVVWIGPLTPLLPGEKDLLVQYVQNGGRALLATNPREGADLRSVASTFGISIDNDVVIDVVQQLMETSVGAQFIESDFGMHEITKKFTGQDGIIFNLTSSVRETGKTEGDTTYTDLISSSAKGWGETDLKSIFESETPTAALDDKDIKGPVSLAVAYEKKIAPEKDKPGSGDAAKTSRLVVFGSTSWITNEYFQYNSQKDLALNALSWLAGEESAISIRPRRMRGSLKPITSQTFRSLVLTGFVIPEVILIFGLLTWWRRRTLAI